ncbi:MAG: hypothetical protein L0228_06985 [Planctomycetes bacterium]|nr:hypothetical protein [Planctomycetota bacterium]
MKANLKGSGGIKGLVLRHGEKVAIVVFGLLALWFAYSSLRLPRLQDQYQASKLQESVTQTTAAVQGATWPEPGSELAPEVRPWEPIDKKAGIRVQDKHYPFRGFDPPVIAASQLRTDPVILNAVDVLAIGGSGLLAFRDEETLKEQERLRVLKEAELRKEEERRAEEQAERAAEGLEGGQPGGRRRGGLDEGGPEFAAGEFDPDHPNRRLIEGIASPAGVPLQGGERLEQVYWATIVAKVPIREQLKRFQDAFQNARGGFDPARDFPRYIGYEVQRTSVEPGKPPVWTNVPVYDGQKNGKSKVLGNRPAGKFVNEASVVKLAGVASTEWAGPAIEPVDSRWTDSLLTMPLPPLVGRDFDADATHPDIPLAVNAPPVEQEIAPEPTATPADEPADADESFSAATPGQLQPGASFNMPMRSSYPGAGGIRGGGFPRGELGELGGGFRGRGFMRGMDQEEGMMRGGFPGGGMGAMAGGIASGQRMELPREVDYLLLRFFDFTVEKGKKYKYRVKIYLADPNYGIAATSGMLDSTVLDRQRKEATAAKAKKRAAPYFRGAAEFSEPSPTVGIPLGGLVHLAEAKLPSVKVHNDEPAVKLIAETFDIELADSSVLHVAHEKEFRRGAVVNLKEKMRYTGENDRWIDTKDDPYELNTGLTLLDIDGADTLVKDITSPSRVLLMDVAGQLSVRDELADASDVQYLRLIFNEDKRRQNRAGMPDGEFGPEVFRGPPGGGRGGR